MAFEITSDTVVKILVRRGLEVERMETLLSEGELGYSVDSRRLFIGDGYNLGGNPVGNVNFGIVNNRLQYLPFAQPGDMIRQSNFNYIFSDGDWQNANTALYRDSINIGGVFNIFQTLEYATDPSNALRIAPGGLGDGLVVDYVTGPSGDILNTIQGNYSTVNFDARFLSLCAFRSIDRPNDSYRIGSLYFGNIFTKTIKNNLSATVNVERNVSINDHTLSAYQLQMYARDLNVNGSLIDAASGSLYLRSKGPIYLGTSSAGGSGLSISDTNVTVYGNLSVLGDLAYLNSVVSVTSALSVVNDGTGPAFVVNQKGTQPVAHFQDDGATALFIADGGNVGIGTTTPAEKLTVSGNISASGSLSAFNAYLRNSATTNDVPVLRVLGDSTKSVYGQYQNFTAGVSASTDISVYNDTANYLDMGIASSTYNGNQYAPVFNVVGAGDSYLYTTANDLIIGTSSAGTGNDIVLFTGGTLSGSNGNERMRITNAGRVGIGTDTPAEKLTVSGNISSNGTLYTTGITSRDLNLIHSPANDGINSILRIGECTVGDTALSGFSGAFISYDESTNVFGISSVFADTQWGVPAIAIDRTGYVGIGTMTPITKFEVNGSMRVGRGNDLQFNGALKWGSTNGGNDASSYMSGFANSTEQIRIDTNGVKISDSKALTLGVGTNIALDTTTGSKIGTLTTQKLGFYNATPVVQPTSPGLTAPSTTGSGTTLFQTTKFNGGAGTEYSVADIVKVLKNLGLIAA